MNDSSSQLKKTNFTKVCVLVSAGKHPGSGVSRYCRNDAISLSLASKLAESAPAHIEVLHASHSAEYSTEANCLADYLALGAERLQVISTAEGEDITPYLTQALANTKPDLILTGSRAENGADSGLLPYLLAESLGLPIVANVLEIKPLNGSLNTLEVVQFLPKGKRRRIAISLPAILMVHPFAPAELHYATAKKTTGEITWLPSVSNAQQLMTAPLEVVSSKPSQTHRPIKLKVQDGQYTTKKTGHERLTAAITVEAKGGTVVIDTSYVEKAQVILRYLRDHHLINF